MPIQRLIGAVILLGVAVLAKMAGAATVADEQRDEQIRKEQYQRLMAIPLNAAPSFCWGPDQGNGLHPVIPPNLLTPEQIEACTEAGKSWAAQKKRGEQQAQIDYAKTKKFEKVEADNGAAYLVDVGHAQLSSLGVMAFVFDMENEQVVPYRRHAFLFDCRGHYSEMGTGEMGPDQYAPPRSVVGVISAVACKAARANLAATQNRSPPTPRSE
jgi:hypothetical protein